MTRPPRWRTTRPIVAAAIAAAVLLSCSSSDPGPTARKEVPAEATLSQKRVEVALKDFGLVASPGSIQAGPVAFAIQNSGAAPHEFVIVQSGLAPDQLPQIEQKFVDLKQLQVIATTGPIDGGKREDVAVNLRPGRYVLLCNVASHYISGMYAAFSVSER